MHYFLSIYFNNKYLHVETNYLNKLIANNAPCWFILYGYNNNNNNNNNYLLQLGCQPVAVVILHVNKT